RGSDRESFFRLFLQLSVICIHRWINQLILFTLHLSIDKNNLLDKNYCRYARQTQKRLLTQSPEAFIFNGRDGWI
ncbi:MAG: hypothetical protein AB1Z38_14515, partial [Desulfotignum sp.]